MKMYGKAGQFAKAEAHRRFDRLMWWLAPILICGGAVMGVGVGVILLPWVYRLAPIAGRVPAVANAALGLGFELFAAAVCWALFRAPRDPMDRLARQRTAILAGGQAEALVAWRLTALGEGWHLFNGVAMKAGGDLDHVLVGPGGVFAISTKSQRGIDSADPAGQLLHNGKPCGHADDARRRAMRLRTWLEVLLQPIQGSGTVPFVQAVLVNPMTHMDVGRRQLQHLWITDDADLVDMVGEGRRPLPAATVDACVSELIRVTGLTAANAKGGLTAT